MNIDWAKIRETVKRIDQQLAATEKVLAERDVANDWPEVTRRRLEEAFPRWREEFGKDWRRDFLEKKIGKGNYRAKPGSRKYRIDPEVLAALKIEPDHPAPGPRGR
jgi:hypothetical protein